MYLENRIRIEEWKEKYKNDVNAQIIIENYLKNYSVAMEIQKFQNTSSVSLEEIKNLFPNFLTPQMYYYLDEYLLLPYLESNLVPIGEPIIHIFDRVTGD